MKLNQTFQKSNQLLKKNGKTFYFARIFLDKKSTSFATRLYGTLRQLDDLVDAKKNIISKNEIEKITRDIACGKDLADIFQSQYSKHAFSHFIDGMLWDLSTPEIQTVDELLRYCYLVAGTVGVMMTPCLVACDHYQTDEKVLSHASDLGIAMQLTNICRDVFKDKDLGRTYLPKELVDNLENTIQLKHALTTLLDLADGYYESGLSGLCYLKNNARRCIYTAAKSYKRIGYYIRESDYDVRSKRHFVPLHDKVAIAISSCFQTAKHLELS